MVARRSRRPQARTASALKWKVVAATHVQAVGQLAEVAEGGAGNCRRSAGGTTNIHADQPTVT